jgi:hypothetical protein
MAEEKKRTSKQNIQTPQIDANPAAGQVAQSLFQNPNAPPPMPNAPAGMSAGQAASLFNGLMQSSGQQGGGLSAMLQAKGGTAQPTSGVVA